MKKFFTIITLVLTLLAFGCDRNDRESQVLSECLNAIYTISSHDDFQNLLDHRSDSREEDYIYYEKYKTFFTSEGFNQFISRGIKMDLDAACYEKKYLMNILEIKTSKEDYIEGKGTTVNFTCEIAIASEDGQDNRTVQQTGYAIIVLENDVYKIDKLVVKIENVAKAILFK